MKLMVAEKRISVVFVVRDDSSFSETCDAADSAMSDQIRDMYNFEVDLISPFVSLPEGWTEDCLPYDPQDVCEEKMTIKEILKMKK